MMLKGGRRAPTSHRVRRLGVGGEDQEFIVAVHANPGSTTTVEVARALSSCQQQLRRRASKRMDTRKVRSRNAICPEHRMAGTTGPNLRRIGPSGLSAQRPRARRTAGVRKEAAHVDVELVLRPEHCGS